MFRVIQASAMFAVVLASCVSQAPGASPTPVAAKGPSGTVTERLVGDWATLDPQFAQLGVLTEASLQINMANYDRLLAIDAAGKLIPYVATTWKATPTEMTFTLRTDVKCADGTPLTPTAVANSFKRWFAPETKSATLSRFFGPGPYSASADETAGSLTLKLGTPVSEALISLGTPYASIICPAGISNPSLLQDGASGSGAFTIDSGAHGDAMKLKARRDWTWGPDRASAESAGFPDQLVYKVVGNETTAANLLLTGGLDIARVQGADVPRLTSSSLVPKEVEAYVSDNLRFNEDAGRPTADRAIREALMTAIDPVQYNKVATNGASRVSPSAFAPQMPCYDAGTADLFKPNVARARTVLQSAGYTLGSDGKLTKDGKPLAINMVGSNVHGDAPAYAAEQLRSIGVNVTLRVGDQSEFARAAQAGDFDVIVGQSRTPYPSPSYSINSINGGPPPASRTHDQTLLAEITAAQVAPLGSPEGCQHWANAQRRLLTEFHLLPVGVGKAFWFSRGVSFEADVQWLEPTSIRRN